MIQCTELRWQFSRFLNGETSPETDEIIRNHLDECPNCARRLASAGSMNSIELHDPIVGTADITDRVLQYFPESPSGFMMIRHLVWVFIISALFGVGIYQLVRKLASVPVEKGFEPSQVFSESGFQLVSNYLASHPLLSYTALAIGATVLCIVLIYLIDSPKNSRSLSDNR